MQLQVKSLIVPVWKPAKGQITRNWGAMRTPISCAPVVAVAQLLLNGQEPDAEPRLSPRKLISPKFE